MSFLSLPTTNARRMIRRVPGKIPSRGPIGEFSCCSMKRPADVSKLRELLAGKSEVEIDLVL